MDTLKQKKLAVISLLNIIRKDRSNITFIQGIDLHKLINTTETKKELNFILETIRILILE